jgi:hypothetical protein
MHAILEAYLVVHEVSITHVVASARALLDVLSYIHLYVPFCRGSTAPRSCSSGVQRNGRTTTFFHLHHVTQRRIYYIYS